MSNILIGSSACAVSSIFCETYFDFRIRLTIKRTLNLLFANATCKIFINTLLTLFLRHLLTLTKVRVSHFRKAYIKINANYTIYNKEETDKCKASNKTLGNIPKITVGINKAINKKYSLLLISLTGSMSKGHAVLLTVFFK